ncbi:MAG TPA: haloacid dehalogenase-like hydrolase [Solirubrobacteraceae bacterium]
MLILFDIDGTLLRGAASEHALALRRALHEVYRVGDPEGSRESLPTVALAGRTDLEIARDVLLLCGRSARVIDNGLGRLEETLVREYALCAPEDLSDRVVPGMDELVAELAQDTEMRLSLVTGNIEPIARSKLRRAGLGEYFESGQGGFGSDSEDRTDLPEIARRRAGTQEKPYPRERTVVIGDTPRDIACARADGLRCLAVTSGPYTSEELDHADAVAENTSQLRGLLLRERQRDGSGLD